MSPSEAGPSATNYTFNQPSENMNHEGGEGAIGLLAAWLS